MWSDLYWITILRYYYHKLGYMLCHTLVLGRPSQLLTYKIYFLFSVLLFLWLSLSLRVEEDGDEVAAAAADVDGDVPEAELAGRLDTPAINSKTVGHLQWRYSYYLTASQPLYLPAFWTWPVCRRSSDCSHRPGPGWYTWSQWWSLGRERF